MKTDQLTRRGRGRRIVPIAVAVALAASASTLWSATAHADGPRSDLPTETTTTTLATVESTTTLPPTTTTTQPIGHGNDPCAAFVDGGWFEPTQGVWQDDPGDIPPAFPDRPGKQLTRTSPTSYNAELPMVTNKATLLFGINHAVGDPPDNTKRHVIMIYGRTTGTVEGAVMMHFSTKGTPSTLDYTSPILGYPKLLPPCGPPHPFAVAFDVPKGAPLEPNPAFRWIGGTGAYTIVDELVGPGAPGGIQVTVSGQVVRTKLPHTVFIGVDLGAHKPGTLYASAFEWAKDSNAYVPDLMPVPKDIFASRSRTIDLERLLAKAQVSLGYRWKSFRGANEYALNAAVVAEALSESAVLGNNGRVIGLLDPSDYTKVDSALGSGALGGAPSGGEAVTQKAILLPDSLPRPNSVAHELVHTLPTNSTKNLVISWMVKECGTSIHDLPTVANWAHGFRITDGWDKYGLPVESRFNEDPDVSYMSSNIITSWSDQCTWRHLIPELEQQQDPPVILVQGIAFDNGVGTYAGDLSPAFELGSIADLSTHSSGSWAIVLRDRSHNVLHTYHFTPQFDQADGGRVSTAAFSERVPNQTGVAEIDLYGPHGMVDRRVYAASAPSVHFTTPKPGTTLSSSGAVHLTWSIGAARSTHPVTTVLDSTDGGSTWTPLSVDQDGTTYNGPLDKGHHLVKVWVSDGTRSTETVTSVVIG